jgi:hypothetical protein
MTKATYEISAIRAAAEASAFNAYERRLKDMLLQLLPLHEAAAERAPTADYEPTAQEITAFRQAVRRHGHKLDDENCIAEALRSAHRARGSA